MARISYGALGALEVHELVCVIHKPRSDRSAESRLRREVLYLIWLGLSLDDFQRDLQAWMEATSVGNHCTYWTHYKLERVGETRGRPVVEVWHLNAWGDKDRKCLTIKPKDND